MQTLSTMVEKNLALTNKNVCSDERSTSSDFLNVEIVWFSFSVCKWFSLAWANKGVNVPIILFASALSASVNSETKKTFKGVVVEILEIGLILTWGASEVLIRQPHP